MNTNTHTIYNYVDTTTCSEELIVIREKLRALEEYKAADEIREVLKKRFGVTIVDGVKTTFESVQTN